MLFHNDWLKGVICNRPIVDVDKMCKKVEDAVKNEPNQNIIIENEMYALKLGDKWWRAKLKFRRPKDDIPALHLLDATKRCA